MLAACLQAGGIDAIACGNIGHPFTTAARAPHDALVVEVSSFQLDLQTSFHPVVSLLLNLAPDHLDHHGSFDAYRRAKASIYARQNGSEVHVGNRDDAAAAAVSAEAPCHVRWFRAGKPQEHEVGYEGAELLARIDRREVRLGVVEAGRAGYREDAAAAAAAALAYGVAPDAIAAGIAAYAPAAHRGEVVAEIDGVRFLDNSKATNVHAALAAIAEVRDAVLLAGGRAKGQDLSPLGDGAGNLVAVIAMGEASAEIEAVFAGRLPVTSVGTIEEAVWAAFAQAPRPGVVLLAPGCASWDQFASYVERGERFAAAARGLVAQAGAHG
jgi:UDP-N-acetylmuramoylalanine--D-glutamate ligase